MTPKVTISPAAAASQAWCAEPGESFSVLKDMVGREHGDDRLRIALCRPGGRGADGRGAVAPVRLEQNHRLGADLPQLLGDAKAIVEIGDDHRRIENSGVVNQTDNRLKGRTLPDQGNELLRQALPRFGPHAGAGPAAHDHRLYFGHSFPGSARRNRQPGFLCNNGGVQSNPAIWRGLAAHAFPVARLVRLTNAMPPSRRL